MKQNPECASTKVEEDRTHGGDGGSEKKSRPENEADLRVAISQPRASGSQTLRTSKLSLTMVQRGGRREGETHTAETQVIPQLKGLWVWTLRRVLAFTRCWGNGGVCQMSASYP